MLTLSYGNHTLIGVPAVHNRAVFAEIVNRTCAGEETRPDAVVVELDPAGAKAAAGWLTELGAASGEAPLPCMLGLSRRNKKIHPRFREAALHLQEATGLQLHEIAPDVLHRELGYSAVSLLCLSPADSIIEAIRCALELEVPLYGIDMDDTSLFVEGGAFTCRDPVSARDDFGTYIRLHGHLADRARDDHSNTRREIVMAARLKRLLMRHRRVLFTCGLGHWRNITRLLADEDLLPARDVPQEGPVTYTRVLVHPLKALQCMDIFPAITAAYESLRQPANCSASHSAEVDFQEQFQRCLERTNSRYFDALTDEGEKFSSPESNHGFISFGNYLINLCLLAQQFTPDLSVTLSTARSMMPGHFVNTLGDVFMEFPWVSPADFPNLPVIGPDTPQDEGNGEGSGRTVLQVPTLSPDGSPNSYERSEPFYMSAMHVEEGRGRMVPRWKWPEEPPPARSDEGRYCHHYIWPPCENLFYASMYEAVNIADACRQDLRTEAFTDSLHDGLDLKASLHSCISGKNRLFVRRAVKKPARPVRGEPVPAVYSGQLELQPAVFIFSRETEKRTFNWDYLRPGDSELYDDLSPKGKRLFDRLVGDRARTFVESIHVGELQPVPEYMKPWVRSLRLLHGSVRFGNPCVNFFQSAAWLEKGRFKVSPMVYGYGGVEEIIEMYRERHQIVVDRENWGNALIQIALPYTPVTRRVIVVAPKDFRISGDVRNEARRRRVELFQLPLSSFPTERINLIRRQYAVMAGQGGKEYPPELERIFGHHQHTYRNLLPREIRRQSRPRHTEQRKEERV